MYIAPKSTRESA